MKFEIRITDATEVELSGLLKYLEKRQKVSEQVDSGLKKWSGKRRKLTKAEHMRRQISPEAPHGLKKDGTPRKKPGRPPIKWEF